MEEEDEGKSKDGEDGTAFAGELPFAAARSRWQDTIEVLITATDLSALLMMRARSSSLLPE